MDDRMRKRILKQIQEKKNNPEKVDRFHKTPEVMYGKIAEYSPSMYKGRITVGPMWYERKVNSQYRDTVRSVEDHVSEHRRNFPLITPNRPPDPDYAYWIHTTEFEIRLPFRYTEDKSRRKSLEYRMIVTKNGTKKRNEIFNTPVPSGRPGRTTEMEFINFGVLDQVFSLFRAGQYIFRFHYKVRIPNSQQLENAGREQHDENQVRLIEEDEESDIEPEPFEATEWWKDNHQLSDDLYTDDQITDMQRRWQEHLIQLAPKACNLLLPRSTTKIGDSTYKLRADHDYLLKEEFWRSEIKNGWTSRYNFTVQNNKVIKLSKKGGWAVNLKAPLKF